MNSICTRSLFLLIPLIIFFSCSKEKSTHFIQLSSSETNIDFSNNVENTPEFNIQNYLYFYDGGGVAAGDINNDGLPDLFFTGNSVPNRLYINKGNFQFEDITESAGITHIPDSWSTGVTMADVNGDNHLDIYISKVNYLNKKGPNQLFINNGDLTFTERASEFGLDFEGYSTQAAFFDYDVDGDLDLFLLNHSFHSEETYGPAEELRQRTHPQAGDRLFRNDGDSFTDVTQESGIYSSALGYGLGIAVTDINQDGYPDIYIGNDFHEDDYFYINNGDGTFSELLYEMMGHTSSASMGNDAGDINNDGLTDIVSLDMMPNDHEVYMSSGGPDMVVVAQTKERFGFGNNNNRNTLQVNQGFYKDGLPRFSETAFASGIAKTEWSWSALLADFNNNGFQDLYITNGLPKRPNELDYVSTLQRVRQQFSGQERDEQVYSLVERMSSVHVSNYMFQNNKDLTFTDVTNEWGFDEPSYSNGAVYTDLNDDGKLDIVVNNINREAFVYRNNFATEDSTHFLKVKLNGEAANTSGIGAKLFAYVGNQTLYREQMPTRGFHSSVDHILHFGLDEHTVIDSLLVIWPDRRYQKLLNIQTDQTLKVSQSNSKGEFDYDAFRQSSAEPLLTDVSQELGINHSHTENTFDDFNREPLMPYKLSKRGPALAVGDVNGDGLDDFYLGGSKGYAGKLFIQQEDGSFNESPNNDFRADSESEDVDAIFFDANGDGLNDLYVVTGGNELTGNAPDLLDKLYLNQGNGDLRRARNNVPAIPVNSSVVRQADIDGDGDPDLFVGGHSIPWRYGVGPKTSILKNDGNGFFTDVTQEIAPDLQTAGNITSAAWIQNPDKSVPDLIIAGEWMNVQYFENQQGNLVLKTDEMELGNLNGLWQGIHSADLDGNGYQDIILGNFGTNSRFEASQDSPLKLYINDFNENGQTAPIIAYSPDGTERPFEQLDEILAQIPGVQERVRSYRDYASKSLEEIFTPAKLDSALEKEVTDLRSMVLMNSDNGEFIQKLLPVEAQLFPVFDILAKDINDDGILDLLLGGNLYDVKPSVGGRQDAGFGLVLIGKGNGEFQEMQPGESGFFAEGEIRSIQPIEIGKQKHVIVARNNQSPLIFRINSAN